MVWPEDRYPSYSQPEGMKIWDCLGDILVRGVEGLQLKLEDNLLRIVAVG
jgi:hypothetical protein